MAASNLAHAGRSLEEREMVLPEDALNVPGRRVNDQVWLGRAAGGNWEAME